MKQTLPAIICAAMLILAGCSSKSAVSTSDGASGSGYAPMTGSASTVMAEPGQDATVAGPVIGDIFFDFDSSSLNTEAQEQLKQNAAWLGKKPETGVTIQGHCDERGTDEYNLALGERRASAARDYLMSLGIQGGRLSIVSFGEEMPFHLGHNEEAWAKNRRAHFITR